ncbi:hypothetical protein [Cellulosilyticum sp. I15G10I2]|uniref:hypothetical protein n=1 Tax=Cellulosilyticum sp. I15G10I2 TaxID=1892843 RepID=UPI00114C8A61|nr:hypothetical protein [Cellulosilyticum sp. I15G10I2]
MAPKIVISGSRIICCEIMTVDMVLPAKKYILLKGIVYSPNGEPLPDVAVEVLQINRTIHPPVEKRLGVTFTMQDGSYGISLPRACSGYSYKLIAYSAIYP